MLGMIKQFGISLDVLVDSAELQIEHLDAPEVMTDVELIGGPDAAMNLHGGLHDKSPLSSD